jgi:two-component system, NarL family, response regulator NreC
LRFTPGGSQRFFMRILMISDQERSATLLNGFLQKYSEAYWEVPLEQLQYLEIWQERQPDLLVTALPIGTKYGQLIRDLQTQISLSVLIHCSEMSLEMLEKTGDIQPQAILVHPVTEPQLIATLHLIRLSRSVAVEPQLKALSSREREVLQLVLKGFSSKEIGQRLFVSMNTVNTHKRRIKEKLGVRRLVEVKGSLL